MTEAENSRQDLLVFNLAGRQQYGLNVLKIKEIIPLETLNHLPDTHPAVVGVARLRGKVLPVIDLSKAIGGKALDRSSATVSIIVTEFNRVMQGFLVMQVERIVPIAWESILPPPKAAGKRNYVTGIARYNDALVEILDVEKVLSEVSPPADPSEGIAPVLAQQHLENLQDKLVLVVDDSQIARKQVANTLDALGVEYLVTEDGKKALAIIHKCYEEGRQIDMIISDIEMPEMDGYTLTKHIRAEKHDFSPYILLHTSLAGNISTANAATSGADASLTKFASDDLSKAVIKGLTAIR